MHLNIKHPTKIATMILKVSHHTLHSFNFMQLDFNV
jgi:hypothetical protein